MTRPTCPGLGIEQGASAPRHEPHLDDAIDSIRTALSRPSPDQRAQLHEVIRVANEALSRGMVI